MANLRYSDKHNMVAFLKKPNESVGFSEIVDFLKASIDNKKYTITEAYVRSKLQLADAAGISNLPDAEIYNGLAPLGPKSGGWDQFGSPIATALICLSSNRVYNFSKLIFDGMIHNIESNTKFLMGYAGDHVPLLPAMLKVQLRIKVKDTEIPQSQGPTFTYVADELTTTGVRVGTEGATTTTSGLDAGLDSGSAEDSLQLKELMVLVPKLVTRIANLEKELHQTKTTYGKAVHSISLVRESMKEKDTDCVTPTKISASGEVQEQDISPTTLEAAKTLSQVISHKAKSTDKGIRYKRKTRSKSIEKDISTDLDADIEVNPGSEDFNIDNEDFNTGSLGVSTGSGPVSTPSVVQTINVTIPSPIKRQREGKAPMTTEENSKLQTKE
ncbi:hypothetical protein Tco_0711439 [Tanacetum coccineum]